VASVGHKVRWERFQLSKAPTTSRNTAGDDGGVTQAVTISINFVFNMCRFWASLSQPPCVPRHPASSTTSSSSRQRVRKPPPRAGSCSPLWQFWAALQLLSACSQPSLLMQLLPLPVS
jgi:hypothetical protein